MKSSTSEKYRLKLSLIVKFIIAIIAGQKRDMGADVATTITSASPDPQIINSNYII